MKSIAWLVLLSGCSSFEKARISLALTALKQAQEAVAFAPGELVLTCASGDTRTFAIDLTQETFEATAPACGAASFALVVATAEDGIVALVGRQDVSLVGGDNDITITAEKRGELLVENAGTESCELLVDGESQGMLAPGEMRAAVVRIGMHAVSCGTLQMNIVSEFAKRAPVKLSPEMMTMMMDMPLPGGTARPLGPTRVYAGRRHVYDASWSTDLDGGLQPTMMWLKDDVEIAACHGQLVCLVPVPASDKGFKLTARVLPRSTLEGNGDTVVQVQAEPLPAHPASIKALGAQANASTWEVNGGYVRLRANGSSEALITTEPPPTAVPYTPVLPTDESCTLTIHDDACAAMPTFQIAATEPLFDVNMVKSCDKGGDITTANANLRHLKIIYDEQVGGPSGTCTSLDLRGLGNVDVEIVFAANASFAPTGTGDGFYVSTNGKVWITQDPTAVISLNQSILSALAPLPDTPEIRQETTPTFNVSAGGEIRINDFLHATMVGLYANTPGQVGVILDSSDDVVLAADIAFDTTASSGPPFFAATGKRVFLPALTQILASGAPRTDANLNQEAGDGGFIFLRVKGPGTNQIYLSEPLSQPLALDVQGGQQLTAQAGSAGGYGGQLLLVAEDGTDTTFAAAGVLTAPGGDAPQTPGNGGGLVVDATGTKDVNVALMLQMNAMGGGSKANDTFTIFNTGNGGFFFTNLTHHGAETSDRHIAFTSTEPIALSGGACAPPNLPGQTTGVINSGAGGYGGQMSVASAFSPLASGGPQSRVLTRVLSTIAVRGSSCDLGDIATNAAGSYVSTGNGGRVELDVGGHTEADLALLGAVDARGGDAAMTGVYPGYFDIFAGSGGTVRILDYVGMPEDAKGTTRVRFANAILLNGGALAGAGGANLRGGGGGAFECNVAGSDASAILVDATAQMSLDGGDAVGGVDASAVYGGGGGLFTVITTNGPGVFPAAFSQCVYPTPDVGPAGGTASGASPSLNPGGTGGCEWTPPPG